MPANIEIKARLRDLASLRARVEALSERPGTLLTQVDTFYACAQGRLKLRVLGPADGELIAYSRADITGPKSSTYERLSLSDPAALNIVLTTALDVRGVVRKQRWLYHIGQTRVHLDRVEGLGDFVELEVVLRPDQTAREGEAIATALMHRLAIRQEDLVAAAYIDLLQI